MVAEDTRQKEPVVNMANKMQGLLKRTFANRDSSLWKNVSLIKPHLEYAIQAWNPHLNEDT